MNKGFLRVAAAVPKMNVADCAYNVDNIIAMCCELSAKNVQVAVFPEMSVSGYTCGDLFLQSTLIEATYQGLERITKASERWNMLVFVGASIKRNGKLYNCAVAISSGKIVGVVPKIYLPVYSEFYDKRWWQSAVNVENGLVEINGYATPFVTSAIFRVAGVGVGVEICEDAWAPIPPSTALAMSGAQVIVNLSASNDVVGKYSYLKSLIANQSARCRSAYVYSAAGYGESSTDVVFDGKAIIAENGSIVAESNRWSTDAKYVISDIDIDAIDYDRRRVSTFGDCREREFATSEEIESGVIAQEFIGACAPLYRQVNPHPFVPSDLGLDGSCREAVNIQTLGLARRLEATRTKALVVGISGGLDSTLALLVAIKTFDMLGLDRKGIIGVTMPGFGTTDRTYNNALKLMSELGITWREISIVPAVTQHFKDINHEISVHDVTYENSQARERTQILMDVANQVGGMVLGTGDLSELALGWATYNGDHMSMYGVNAGVPKTLVKYLVRWFAEQVEFSQVANALRDIIDTPISPELVPADENGEIKQKTEDLVGPYELHDFVLYHVLGYGFSPSKIYFLAQKAFDGEYSDEVIRHWMKVFYRRFFNQQFKRSCMPDGPKAFNVSLSPRGDWKMPSDASSALWLEECDNL